MNQAEASELIRSVRDKRIVFAHQSVGADILDGVGQIAAIAGARLNIDETRTPAQPSGLYHFKVGRNRDPLGKLRDFESTAPVLANIDAALVKLCYVDIEAGASAESLAGAYLDALERMRQRLPHTRVIAVTCPLTTVQRGPKAHIKRLLGRAPHGYEANARRHAFNEIVRARTASRDVFDLAGAESEDSEGATFSFRGSPFPALAPRFTSDGGHLNEAGKLHVARRLLECLAR